MATTLKQPTDSDIFARVVAADDSLPVSLARTVLGWKFPAKDLGRVRMLQTKNNAGTITQAERQLLESYVRIGQFVAIMQAKARLALKSRRRKA